MTVWDGEGTHGRIRKMPLYKITEITDSVGSPDYAKNFMPGQFGIGEIVYRDIGSIIRKRMNELFQKKYKSDFMGSGDLDSGLLLKAERTLTNLASENILKNIQTVGK